MTQAAALLGELRAAGVSIVADRGLLRVEAPRGVVTVNLRERIAQHKPALLSLVGSEQAALAADWPEEALREIAGLLAKAYERYRGVPRVPEDRAAGQLAVSPDVSVHGEG